MYILGIPQGCFLERGLAFFSRAWTCRKILLPVTYLRMPLTCRLASILPTAGEASFKMYPKGFCFYVCITDLILIAYRQVAPSGVIDPLRSPPGISASLLAYVTCVLALPPQVKVLGGVPLSAPVAAPSGGVLLGMPSPYRS